MNLPPPSRNRVSERPVESDGENHQPDVDGLAPCIEQQRKREQHDVFRRTFGHEEVDRQEQWQKREKEYGRREDHEGDYRGLGGEADTPIKALYG